MTNLTVLRYHWEYNIRVITDFCIVRISTIYTTEKDDLRDRATQSYCLINYN